VGAYIDFWAGVLSRGSYFPVGSEEAHLFGLGQVAGIHCVRVQREVTSYVRGHGKSLGWCRRELGPELSALIYGDLTELPDRKTPTRQVFDSVRDAGVLDGHLLSATLWGFATYLQVDGRELKSYRTIWEAIEVSAAGLLLADPGEMSHLGRFGQALNAAGPLLCMAIDGQPLRAPVVDLQVNPLPVGPAVSRK
jgi:hypothetical protein